MYCCMRAALADPSCWAQVFLVFLYQRYIYPVDKTRPNEFGYASSLSIAMLPAQSAPACAWSEQYLFLFLNIACTRRDIARRSTHR